MIDPQRAYEPAEPPEPVECQSCGGDSYPCECDERARDDYYDRKFEGQRERRYEA